MFIGSLSTFISYILSTCILYLSLCSEKTISECNSLNEIDFITWTKGDADNDQKQKIICGPISLAFHEVFVQYLKFKLNCINFFLKIKLTSSIGSNTWGTYYWFSPSKHTLSFSTCALRNLPYYVCEREWDGRRTNSSIILKDVLDAYGFI